MDMDDDDRGYIPQDRYSREVDPRDPRALNPPRHGLPVTSGYMQESGFPAYALSAAQAGASPMAFEPRVYAPTGNTTPPTGFRAPGFPPSDFPGRTGPPAPAAIPAQAYMDSRASKIVGQYPSYPAEQARNRR